MKNLITLLFVFISISTFSQEIGIGTTWTYNNSGIFPFPGEALTDDYTITGEEIINSKTYFVFDNFGSCGPAASHLRIEDRRYYMIIQGEEALIHDFNLQPGESYLMKNYIGYSGDSIEIVIDSIGTTIVAGDSLYTQFCSLLGANNGFEWNLTFIENIGSIGFILPQFGACDPITGNLRCITYSDEKTIKFTTDDDCEIFYGNSYLQKGSQWYYGKWGVPTSSEIVQIIIERDTINNFGKYNVMEILDEDDNLVEGSQILLISGNNKVYFVEENASWKLLFDFSPSLEVGDTVTYYLPENANFYDISSNGGIEPIINPYSYAITGIDTVFSSTGTELRRWQVEDIPKVVDNQIIGNDIREIVEGVGSTNGLMRRGTGQLTGGEPESFRCFFSNQFNYTEIQEDACEGLSDGLLFFAPEVRISPNPTDDYFNIKTEKSYNIATVINIHGQKVRSFQFGEELTLNGLTSGVYFIKIDFEDGSLNKKIVKL